jgi:DNA-binding NtrC family response regulator
VDKVLIIEKDSVLAISLAEVVESHLRLSPVIACNEGMACELVFNFNYALIISDTLSKRPHLATEQGGDRWRWIDWLQKQLRQMGLSTPLVMMTEYPQFMYGDFILRGLKGFITKPLDPVRVINEISRVTLRKDSCYCA